MVKRWYCLRILVLTSAFVMSCGIAVDVFAQDDLKGGATESTARPKTAPPRSKPRSSTQSKSTKRTPKTGDGGSASSQPKADLSKQVESALELGNSARDSNPPRFAEAERAYKLAADLDPVDARAHVGLGNTYFDQKRYAEAQVAFSRAIELDPQDADTLVALAYTSNAQERYEDAERSALRAISLDANEYAAYVAIGWSKYKRKNYQEAETAYRRAIALSPKTSAIYSELSLVLIEQARWHDSEVVLLQAVTLDPSNASTLVDYGVVLHKLGQLDKAAETYTQVIKLDPKMSSPHSNLALIQYSKGDFAKAREEWLAAQQLKSEYALDRAGLLILDYKLAEAQAELEKYTQANASDEDGWLLLGDVRRMQRDQAGATAAYARAAALTPEYAKRERPSVPDPNAAKAAAAIAIVENKEPARETANPPKVTAAERSTEQGSSNVPSLRFASSIRTIKATNFARPTPASGAISVTCIANAVVVVEPVFGGEAQMSIVPASLTVVAFNQLRTGEYRVVASLDGYEPLETRVFVAATKIVSIKLTLRPKS